MNNLPSRVESQMSKTSSQERSSLKDQSEEDETKTEADETEKVKHFTCVKVNVRLVCIRKCGKSCLYQEVWELRCLLLIFCICLKLSVCSNVVIVSLYSYACYMYYFSRRIRRVCGT